MRQLVEGERKGRSEERGGLRMHCEERGETMQAQNGRCCRQKQMQLSRQRLERMSWSQKRQDNVLQGGQERTEKVE